MSKLEKKILYIIHQMHKDAYLRSYTPSIRHYERLQRRYMKNHGTMFNPVHLPQQNLGGLTYGWFR